MKLLAGVKRRVFRKDDPKAEKASAELSAKRGKVLTESRYTCSGCGYQVRALGQSVSDAQARHLDVHHINDDHHDNDESNLTPACHACHPYQHIGQHGASDAHMMRTGQSFLATIPEVEAPDMNLFLRALGVALNDPQESAVAQQMLDLICERADVTFDEFLGGAPDAAARRTFLTTVAGALSAMPDGEYAQRATALGDQRLVFNPAHLKLLGQEMMVDYPSVPVASWEQVAHSAVRHVRANDSEAGQHSGVAGASC